ncbi:elongation factor 1-beta [Candidatus Pacearchaeota archaeon]|jgi:elongation factor 1-beta|nr:elongation factor 1-beta [Candidatus Pacearchaeota archaeon]
MGIAAVKIKILPTSPEADLEKLKETTKALVEEKGGKNCQFEEEPIAFGLKALIALFAWPEELELENLENSLKEIDEVSSIQVIDMRRAFGS